MGIYTGQSSMRVLCITPTVYQALSVVFSIERLASFPTSLNKKLRIWYAQQDKWTIVNPEPQQKVGRSCLNEGSRTSMSLCVSDFARRQNARSGNASIQACLPCPRFQMKRQRKGNM